MLSPYRVLDLTCERGLLCGQILADLGADVVQVEPPGGSPVRRLPPFYKDQPDLEHSLYWWAYARNKRGIVLDPSRPEGRERLLRLVESADLLIESETPGTLASWGLGYEELARRNPALIAVSITPFGQSGPKSGYADSDLVLMAASGALGLTGDEDLPPLRVSVPQAYLHAAAEAAGAALVALHERRHSGLGQHIDVSVQAAATIITLGANLGPALRAPAGQRIASGVRVGELRIRTLHQAADGYALLLPGLTPAVAAFHSRLMQWLVELGYCERAYADTDWGSFGIQLLLGQRSPDELAQHDALLARFARAHTKQELLEGALARKLLVAPVLRIDELVDSEQAQARGAVRAVAHPGLDAPVRYPGPFAHFARTPLRYRRPPPRLGEHDTELDWEPRPAPQPGPGPGSGSARLPLEGVRVLDLFWVLAGPGATRVLADYGATVVHVESSRRVDTLRTVGPFHDGVPDPDASGPFQNTNAGKLGLALDLSHPDSRAVLYDLVRWADVVTESFSPKVKDSLALDYATLRALNPDLIMISSCLMGQSGPLRDFAGFGQLSASMAAFYDLTGWPDRAPAGPFGAYTDYIGVRYNAIAILAALEYRARTGQGQYIDMAQLEAAQHFLGPAFLDYTVNGRVQRGAGNDDPALCPHGVYAAAGEDRWVAIAVRDARDWGALCAAIERADLAQDPALATLVGRRERRAELDAALAAWTRLRSDADAERALQAAGVPASAVLDMADLQADPQLAHRGHFLEVAHATRGTTTIEASRVRFSRTPARVPPDVPTYGLHNRHVLEQLLGYDPDHIDRLEASGALR